MTHFTKSILLAALLAIESVSAKITAQDSGEKASSSTIAERLPPKIQKIQKELPDWVRKTGNKESAGLMKRLNEQIMAEQFEDAEKTADSLLKMMGMNSPNSGQITDHSGDKRSDKPISVSQEEAVRRLTEKVERVKSGAQKWAAGGRDPAEIIKTMQEEFQPLMKAGKIAEAEAVVDGVLKKLGINGNLAPTALADETSAEERMVARVHMIRKEIPAWIKKTGRKEESDALMKKLKEQLAAMNFAEAEKTANAILKMMGLTPTPDSLVEKPTKFDGSKHATDPFMAFFPIQLVFLASDRIALKPQQRETLLARIKSTQPRLSELMKALESESAALVALASGERVDETAILARIDKFLDLDREARLLQARQGVTIINVLTFEQHAKLRELLGNPPEVAKLEEEFRNRITAKIGRVTQGAEKWAQSGRDPSPFAEAMQEKVRPLMDSGRVFEAEAEIDRVLENLNKDSK